MMIAEHAEYTLVAGQLQKAMETNQKTHGTYFMTQGSCVSSEEIDKSHTLDVAVKPIMFCCQIGTFDMSPSGIPLKGLGQFISVHEGLLWIAVITHEAAIALEGIDLLDYLRKDGKLLEKCFQASLGCGQTLWLPPGAVAMWCGVDPRSESDLRAERRKKNKATPTCVGFVVHPVLDKSRMEALPAAARSEVDASLARGLAALPLKGKDEIAKMQTWRKFLSA
jgi:hypothetical protein